MNHGGCSHATATILPHPRLWGVETLAIRLCNNATCLELEKLMIIITS